MNLLGEFIKGLSILNKDMKASIHPEYEIIYITRDVELKLNKEEIELLNKYGFTQAGMSWEYLT